MAYYLDITLTDEDVLSYEFKQELADTVEIFELRGITAGTSGNTAVYSRAPSSSPGHGRDYVVETGAIPDDQAQCDTWCGLRYALKESLYFDADGTKYRGGELTLRCPGQYNVLDFGGQYVKFNYAGQRTDFDDYLFYLKSVAWEVDPNTLLSGTTFVWQVATAAPDGLTYEPPEEPT